MVLSKPASQRDVRVDGVVDAVGGTGSQKLGSDRVGTVQQVGHGHVVLRFQPAVAVAQPENFAGEVGFVAAAGMPDATIDQNGAAWFDAKWFGIRRIRQSVFRAIEFVDEL